jgi:hypothetical protein
MQTYAQNDIDRVLFRYIIQIAAMRQGEKMIPMKGEHTMPDNKKAPQKEVPKNAPVKTPEPVKKPDPKAQPKK